MPEITPYSPRADNSFPGVAGSSLLLLSPGVRPPGVSSAPAGQRNIRFAPKTTEVLRCRELTRSCTAANRIASFDHLVGAPEHREWERDAERLRSFEVDGQLDPRGLLYRHIGRLLAF